MLQYDLSQHQQIEVGDRVFYCFRNGNMPKGTVREKNVYPESIEYVVDHDDSSFVSYVVEWEGESHWLQLYTKEKYNYFLFHQRFSFEQLLSSLPEVELPSSTAERRL